jgi:hypothetical protein
MLTVVRSITNHEYPLKIARKLDSTPTILKNKVCGYILLKMVKSLSSIKEPMKKAVIKTRFMVKRQMVKPLISSLFSSFENKALHPIPDSNAREKPARKRYFTG